MTTFEILRIASGTSDLKSPTCKPSSFFDVGLTGVRFEPSGTVVAPILKQEFKSTDRFDPVEIRVHPSGKLESNRESCLVQFPASLKSGEHLPITYKNSTSKFSNTTANTPAGKPKNNRSTKKLKCSSEVLQKLRLAIYEPDQKPKFMADDKIRSRISILIRNALINLRKAASVFLHCREPTVPDSADFDYELLARDAGEFIQLYELLLDSQLPNVEKLLSCMDEVSSAERMRELFSKFRYLYASVYELEPQLTPIDVAKLQVAFSAKAAGLWMWAEEILENLQDILRILLQSLKSVIKRLEESDLPNLQAEVSPKVSLRMLCEREQRPPSIQLHSSKWVFEMVAKFDFLPDSKFLVYKDRSGADLECRQTDYCFNNLVRSQVCLNPDGSEQLWLLGKHELTKKPAIFIMNIDAEPVMKQTIDLTTISRALEAFVEQRKTCGIACEYPTSNPISNLRLVSVSSSSGLSRVQFIWEDGERLPGCWIMSIFDLSIPATPKLLEFDVDLGTKPTKAPVSQKPKAPKKTKSKADRKSSAVSPQDTPPKERQLVRGLPQFIPDWIDVAQLPGLLIVSQGETLYVMPICQPEHKLVFNLRVQPSQHKVSAKRVHVPWKLHLCTRVLKYIRAPDDKDSVLVTAQLGVGCQKTSADIKHTHGTVTNNYRWAVYSLKYRCRQPLN